MNTKKTYTKDDLIIRHLTSINEENGIISHTHVVKFGRPLNEAEQHLFRSVLAGFYYTVRFSGKFGGEFVSEPTVEFITPQKAYYTFHQAAISGEFQ